jgi:hypothetical protein
LGGAMRDLGLVKMPGMDLPGRAAPIVKIGVM